MSTVKTSNLQNEASATVNVALDTSGGVAFPQLSGLLVANGSSAVTAPTKLTWSETYTQLSVGGSSWVSTMLSVVGDTPTTSNFSEAFVVAPTLHAACTSGNSIEAWLYTAASTALSSHTYYFARQGSLGAGTTITNQYGFYAHSNLTSATNNYGFYANIPSGTGRWNFYANGTAPNYFAGTTTLAVAPIFSSLTGLVKANGASAATVAARGTDYSLLTAATAVASTSGQIVEFLSLPSGIKRITVSFNGVSTNGASLLQVQIGAGSFSTSGYAGGATTLNSAGSGSATYTSGFVEGVAGSATTAASVRQGLLTICNITGNTWVCSGVIVDSVNNGTKQVAGAVGLGGTLDRVRITTVNGTDSFDAGTINIFYEY